jgi:hypothetical protein
MGTSAAARQQQEEEQLLWSCLGLLDIKQAEGSKLLDISPAMFRKPNAKAFELIMYHAYSIVKGKAGAKKVMQQTRDATAPGWCTNMQLMTLCTCCRTSAVCGLCLRRTRSSARSSIRCGSNPARMRSSCPLRPAVPARRCTMLTPPQCTCAQRLQEWLKEAGRTEHSLAAFQRNPSGPK